MRCATFIAPPSGASRNTLMSSVAVPRNMWRGPFGISPVRTGSIAAASMLLELSDKRSSTSSCKATAAGVGDGVGDGVGGDGVGDGVGDLVAQMHRFGGQ